MHSFFMSIPHSRDYFVSNKYFSAKSNRDLTLSTWEVLCVIASLNWESLLNLSNALCVILIFSILLSIFFFFLVNTLSNKDTLKLLLLFKKHFQTFLSLYP